MRRLRIIEHISMDGVIEIPRESDGSDLPFRDWTAPYRTPAGLEVVLSLYGETFDLLLGRRTYDLWAAFWPHAPATPMAERLRAATKYVVTHRPESLRWGPAQGVPGGPGTGGADRPRTSGPDRSGTSGAELVPAVRRLKAGDGPDLVLAGSSTLTSTLLEHGLADSLVLLVSPVLLGRGRRLFAEGTPPRAFTLERSQALPSGIVIHTYGAAGPLREPPVQAAG